MKLGIIIVTYKTKTTELNSLLKSLKLLKSLMNFPPEIVDNSRNNLGFARGVNLGLKQAAAKNNNLFLILNPDIKIIDLTPRLIKQTAKRFDLFGGRFLQRGTNYYGGRIDYWSLSGGLITQKPALNFSECDFISGSMMFVKKKVIDKIGFLNEQFFLYYEDVDFCYRARRSGFRIGINQSIFYEHGEVSQKNPKKNQYLNTSHQLFIKLQATVWQKFYNYQYLPLKKKLCR